jgi:hypothetical protein
MKKNSEGIIRYKKTNFTMVSNTIICDTNVSLKAKGLYSLIQHYITIPNFILYKSFLMRKCNEGETAFNSAWKELKRKGYLKQRKCRNTYLNHFTYEYDLLDAPVIDSDDEPDDSDESPDPQKRGVEPDPCFAPAETSDFQNVGTISNTEINNTNSINTILSYQSNHTNDQIRNESISEEDKQSNIELLELNIEPDVLIEASPDKKDEITEIFNLICDTVNSDKSYITIAKEKKPIEIIRNIFFKLDSRHIKYVLDSLSKNTTKIKNPRAYLLTTIYNSCFTYTNADNMNFNNTYKDDPYMSDIMNW